MQRRKCRNLLRIDLRYEDYVHGSLGTVDRDDVEVQLEQDEQNERLNLILFSKHIRHGTHKFKLVTIKNGTQYLELIKKRK